MTIDELTIISVMQDARFVATDTANVIWVVRLFSCYNVLDIVVTLCMPYNVITNILFFSTDG